GVQLHKHFARGELAEIVGTGPSRVAASCPHYVSDRCSGCQLQHLSYDAQLAAKRAIVGDALRRIGKLDVSDPEIVEAVEEWRYRAKVSLAVEGGRGRSRTVGFHPYYQPGRVFSLVDCHITDFRLMALWRELKPRLDLLPARLTRLTLRLDRDGRRHILAESSGEPWLDAERLRAALPQGDTVVCWWHPADGASRVVAGPNPPRAGLHWNVTLRLTSQPVARVIYRSCDPATLARDLRRLRVNYRVTAVRAFDLFPQTAHVETVVVLEGA